MGNVVRCCQTLLHYFRCKDAATWGEAERSPLLSSGQSECDSPSLTDDLEDDLLTVCTGVADTNSALEREHFLFPDIILSSNLRGEMTLVEPMVCLLVSEEDDGGGEGARMDEPGDEWPETRYRGMYRFYSEVETQTEVETQIRTGVQTQTESQTEVQTQTEILLCSNKSVEREKHAEVDTQTNTEAETELVQAILADQDVTQRSDAALEAQTGRESHDPWTDRDVDDTKGNDSVTVQDRMESQRRQQTEHNNTETEEDFVGSECCAEPTQQNHKSNEETEQRSVKEEDTRLTSGLSADHMCTTPSLGCDVAQTEGRLGDKESTHIQEAKDQTVTDEPPVEESETKPATLYLVDKLFLAAPHITASPSQSQESLDDVPQQTDPDETKQLSVQDVVKLQESGFPLRIQAPGTESFELQVSGQMLVAELHQVLMDHENTCQRTCFSLQLGGAVLDNQAELHATQGVQDGDVIKVVEDSYSVRDARLHLRHVRDLLSSLDPADAYNGVNGSSLSYLTLYTRREMDSESSGKRRASNQESVDLSPPEYILPGCKDRPLTAMQPVRDTCKPLQCLRILTMSSWNPPPGNRKMHGDLMYLNVLTMEDKELNITSSTRGFYLNQSTAFNFNPKPAVPRILCHSLVELLGQVSPAFRRNFSALQRKRVQRHPYERIATPFQVFTWIAPHGDHTLDCVRAEETHTSRMGQDEHTAGQSREWNEELQGCRELQRGNLQERLHRERSVFKTNSDFVAAATRGAVAVVDGNVMALNPAEPPQMQMFIWNNIFFSLGFDISDHYRPLGGNTAAHAAAVCDLRGTQAYASIDTDGLHTLGTAVVDYRGIRVTAQTIVPGILEKNQEQSVVYGSNDNGETVHTHTRFLELLDKTSKLLRIQRHQVLDHSSSPVELSSSVETKGILGNDGRHYILDLVRTFPPDLNFPLTEAEEKEEVPPECQRLSFPRQHLHSLASLRPELVEAFIQHRYELFTNMVSLEINQQVEANSSEGIQDEDMEQSEDQGAADQTTATTDTDFKRRRAIQRACKAVGSVSDSYFDIRFNPDICSPGVRFPPECAEELQRHRKLLWDAAAFLLSHQIPAVLKDCLDHTAVPMDGASLTSALHQRGVNVRYLGSLLEELDRMEHRERMSHVQRIAISEIIIRSAKHVFRLYLQDVEPAAFSAAVSHFLNCLLSSSSCLPDSGSDELLSRRRSRRRRSHGSRVALLTDSVWARLTPSDLWSRVKTEARGYYHYTVHSESIDEVIERHGLQRISLLREIAIKTGIQVQLREYVFEARHRPAFSEEDVVNMFPVVKHLKPTATDATQLIQQAQAAVQQGLLRDGYELINQALTLFSTICGVLHEDVCLCLRLLGRINYISGEYADALNHQEKAVMSTERLHGIDHPQTVLDYTYLALYCFAGGRLSTSVRLLYRARYLTLLVSGEDHPQVALLDSMLGLVLHGLMEYDVSLKFLQNALILTSKYHGATSLKHARSHHLLATVYESKGEFRMALQHEKESYSIYKSQVGESDASTKESSEYLKSLTQQAVILQKAINQIYSNTPSACVPPPKFPTPSLLTILQQLNLTCGIILLPLSVKDLADLRTELKAQEKLQVKELQSQLLK
ncbi:clustered mitochondria protein homolog [Genypterus blacodes]|uniref:clustered mitochondria protein homolog n=1 Tax=Genypterus blacodes TaxID=154954 RepID=UPI003F75C147